MEFSETNVEELILNFEEGDHQAAGTCKVGHSLALVILNKLIEAITMAAKYLYCEGTASALLKRLLLR